MMKKEDIKEGYFTTSHSQRIAIEKQVLLYKQYSSDDKFWVIYLL